MKRGRGVTGTPALAEGKGKGSAQMEMQASTCHSPSQDATPAPNSLWVQHTSLNVICETASSKSAWDGVPWILWSLFTSIWPISVCLPGAFVPVSLLCPVVPSRRAAFEFFIIWFSPSLAEHFNQGRFLNSTGWISGWWGRIEEMGGFIFETFKCLEKLGGGFRDFERKSR